MPEKGNSGERKTWNEAYDEWADSFFENSEQKYNVLTARGTTERLVYDMPRGIGKEYNTAWLTEMAATPRSVFAALPDVGRSALRYAAAIFRHASVETPGNWHLTEKAPPEPKKQ